MMMHDDTNARIETTNDENKKGKLMKSEPS